VPDEQQYKVWPKGSTNVTCDGNENATQLGGQNVEDGTIWKVAQEFDYEQRLTRVRAANGDIIVNEYDAMGARLKQIKTSGGTATETRMVYALGRVIQERDASDAVTARYYWGDVAAGNAQTVFKKDNGESAKYLVPDGRGSPLENLNKDGTLSGARAYDAFGVTNYPSGTALTPFEYYANLRLSGTQIAMTAQGRPYFAEIGQDVDGGYRLYRLSYTRGDCAKYQFRSSRRSSQPVLS
jgi:hypothetical protein